MIEMIKHYLDTYTLITGDFSGISIYGTYKSILDTILNSLLSYAGDLEYCETLPIINKLEKLINRVRIHIVNISIEYNKLEYMNKTIEGIMEELMKTKTWYLKCQIKDKEQEIERLKSLLPNRSK